MHTHGHKQKRQAANVKECQPWLQADPLFTKDQTAERLGGVSTSFVDQQLALKRLAKVRLSYRTVRIPLSSIERFIAERTVIAGGTL